MKLTKLDKDGFINRVMAKVPTTDYDKEAKNIVQSRVRDLMPKQIQLIYDDESAREYLSRTYVYLPRLLHDCHIIAAKQSRYPELDETLEKLSEKKKKQRNKLESIRDDLKANVYSCSTLNSLKTKFPDLLEFMPEERIKQQLPSVSGVMNKLTECGFPDEKQTS